MQLNSALRGFKGGSRDSIPISCQKLVPPTAANFFFKHQASGSEDCTDTWSETASCRKNRLYQPWRKPGWKQRAQSQTAAASSQTLIVVPIAHRPIQSTIGGTSWDWGKAPPHPTPSSNWPPSSCYPKQCPQFRHHVFQHEHSTWI